MRYLITALLTILLVAPFAWSRIQTLPSSGSSGGLGMAFINTKGAGWRAVDSCLSRIGGNGRGSCTSGAANGVVWDVWAPYSGTPTVGELVCSHNTAVTLTSTWTLRLAYRGGALDAATAYMPGSMVFDSTTVIGESQVLAINAAPALSDGFFMVVVTALTQDAADTGTQTITCMVN